MIQASLVKKPNLSPYASSLKNIVVGIMCYAMVYWVGLIEPISSVDRDIKLFNNQIALVP